MNNAECIVHLRGMLRRAERCRDECHQYVSDLESYNGLLRSRGEEPILVHTIPKQRAIEDSMIRLIAAIGERLRTHTELAKTPEVSRHDAVTDGAG